ncbi:MAG: hypothetical protein K6V73_05320 [Firmicutes bacterium]|nr:hypothetical protein [Bacillota bacterium]
MFVLSTPRALVVAASARAVRAACRRVRRDPRRAWTLARLLAAGGVCPWADAALPAPGEARP